MSSGNWMNSDFLYLKFGTSKSASENWGEYMQPGGMRVIEGLIDISTLTTVGSTVGILSDNVFFPPAGATTASTVLQVGGNSNSWLIEKVETMAETAISSTSATISVGLIDTDRATVPTSYSSGLLASLVSSDGLTAGAVKVFTVGVSGVGNLVGTTPAAATGPYYITGSCNTSNITGKIRVRIYYRGIGTITQ